MDKPKVNLVFDISSIAERLQHEVSLLREWFKKDYPESELRVNCDFNGVLFVLKISIEVLVGQEISSDRAFFKSELRLQEKDLRNRDLVNGFMAEFNTQVRKQIEGSFNRWYHEQAARGNLTNA